MSERNPGAKSLVFIPPDGQEFYNPDSLFISKHLMCDGMEYWNAGSGDAAIRYLIDNDVKAEVIIIVREPLGVFVHFTDANTGREYVLCNSGGGDDEVVIQHAGDPWELPRRYFVSRDMANHALMFFMAQGERAFDLHWEPF